MYGNINPTRQKIERENRAKEREKEKKRIIEKDVSSDRNINLLKEKLKNIVDKEEGRKKMVKNLSEFFGKPPSGGKRKTRRKRGRGRVEWDLLKNLNGENVTVKFNKEKADDEEMGETEFTALLTIEDGGNNDAIKIKFTHHVDGEEEHVFNKTEYENGIITVLGKSNSVYNKVSEAGGRKRKTRIKKRRKKRRKTRKNKRSKKRRGKKRKTRKKRRKRR